MSLKKPTLKRPGLKKPTTAASTPVASVSGLKKPGMKKPGLKKPTVIEDVELDEALIEDEDLEDTLDELEDEDLEDDAEELEDEDLEDDAEELEDEDLEDDAEDLEDDAEELEDEDLEDDAEDLEDDAEEPIVKPSKIAGLKKPTVKKAAVAKPKVKAKVTESVESTDEQPEAEPMRLSQFRNPKTIPVRTRSKSGTPKLPEEGKLLPKDAMLGMFVQHCQSLPEDHPLSSVTTKVEAEAIMGSVNDFVFGEALQTYDVRLFTNDAEEVPTVTLRREVINDKIVRNPSSKDLPYNLINDRIVLKIGNVGQSYRLRAGESTPMTQEEYDAAEE